MSRRDSVAAFPVIWLLARGHTVSQVSATTAWTLVDEPIVNQHAATIEELDAKIAHQCVALAEQREQIQSRTNFHWWPNPIIPN